MRIGIDTYCLYTARTGVRAYVEGLLPALARVAPQHAFVQFRPRRGPRKDDAALSKALNHLTMAGWTEITLPLRAQRAHCDVLLSLEYASPRFAPCPRVVVFYDALFWSDPTHYNRWWRLLQDRLYLPAARRAGRVITISEHARTAIARHTGISPDKIVSIAPAGKRRANTSAADAAADAAVLARYGLRGRAYVLHMGVLEKRKNLPFLVEAIARCQRERDEPLYLVLAGQPGPKDDMDDSAAIRAAIARHDLGERVMLPGYVPDEDVPALYRCSRAYAFPSLQEGFGIPILEAFEHGTPVLAARASALPEIAGDAALYFDPHDAADLARALGRVLDDAALRDDLVARGRARGQAFTWERTARGVLDVLESVIPATRSKGHASDC